MKNILLVVNIVLLVLVGYLYYLYFSSNKKSASQNIPSAAVHHENESARVAYIDLDSLQNNYTYYKKIKADFEKKQDAANNEITALQKKYQTRAMQLQQKGPNHEPAGTGKCYAGNE